MRALRYLAAAMAAAAAAACTVHQSETPPLSGPSDFALTMSVTTSPQTITQNGADASVVTAKLYFTDPRTGQTTPKANVPVRFDMQVAGVAQDYGTLSSRSAVTGADGTARTTYTAPPMPAGGNTGNGCNGAPGQCVTIVATTTDSTVASASGAIASAAATIALVPPGVILPPGGTPTAAFVITPTPVGVNTAATFDASSTQVGNGASRISSYAWTFGDGSTGTGVTVNHTYTAAGTFTVTLTVTNDRGLSASTSQTVSVALPAAPSAKFVFSPTNPVVTQLVYFTADQSSSATGHNITQFSWNYGDGATDSGIAVSHAYAQAGTYVVTLAVLDDSGQRATTSTNVTVGTGNPVPVITFSPTTPSHTAPVFFNSSGTTTSGGATITSYAWDFGDGTTSTSASPSKTFAAGSYLVRLTVVDSQGRTGTVTITVSVS